MQNEDAKQRVRTIRSRVREERELISKLNRTVADSESEAAAPTGIAFAGRH
jgi:hypothetical protein